MLAGVICNVIGEMSVALKQRIRDMGFVRTTITFEDYNTRFLQ
jgi:hypothetical protein